jgi:SAM-dependent methyltransferase
VTVPASFTGSVPAFYDRCLGPVLFEPYAVDIAARLPVREGLRVLELACGTGIVTRQLRAALPPSATLVATDLFDPMLDHARASVPGPGIDWRQADIQALPFDDGAFDVAVCQFGLMFLPDKVQGFREVRRVLAEGGTFLANVWQSKDQNPHTQVIEELLLRLFPDDPPGFLELPHGYHDVHRLLGDMSAAGWDGAELEELRIEGIGPSASEFALGWAKGSPLTHDLIARDADLDAFASQLTEGLTQLGGEVPMTVPLAALVITATR